MSTQLHPAITPTEPAAAPAAPAAPVPAGLLTRLGGVCLAAGPVLFTLGAATAPPADGTTSEDFVASLADHPTQAALSANLLHYSWFGFVFGLLALTQLVRAARRGRALTCVPAVLGAVGAIQISGLPLPAAATVVLGLAAWTPAFAAARLLVVGRPATA